MFGNRLGFAFTVFVVAGVSLYAAWKTADVYKSIRKEEEVVHEWIHEGVHTTPLGKIRVNLASVKWIGPLLVGPVTDPIATCGANTQDKERNLWWFPWPQDNALRLKCLQDNIELERQRHNEFENRLYSMMIIVPLFVPILLAIRDMVEETVNTMSFTNLSTKEVISETNVVNDHTEDPLNEKDNNNVNDLQQEQENVKTEKQLNDILEECNTHSNNESSSEDTVNLNFHLSDGCKLTYDIDDAAQDFTLEDLKSIKDNASHRIKEYSTLIEAKMAILDAIQRVFCFEKKYKTVSLTETEHTKGNKETLPIIIGNKSSIWQTYQEFITQMNYS